ncbi:zinc ribbon domain-containing protein [Humisphaera borealis]|uniref:Zinc-ribbon domain-containing protein n=1 Tax=Humisphaera borealis TaxID=2807512 RepID=A0A7M2X0T4_9BACT|nr:zinc-ribbon domain-containing protein [Humisphaera borealis]QOV90721.1 hypothetical protein IPV69_05010 [Humisphaera borealis]
MGWQDRDYHRKRPDDDEGVESTSYSDDGPSGAGGYRDDDQDADEVDDVDADVTDDDQDLHPEGPDAVDLRRSDEPDLVACPNCRKMILEDAERCPKCGHYVMEEELSRGWPIWVWVGFGLALLTSVLWAFFG